MALSNEIIRKCSRRLLLSRSRILINNGFFGLLLMQVEFRLDDSVGTACTDGKDIYFCPSFLSELDDGELDFILMHEILHMALRHCSRNGPRDHELFNIACDIVVNSNILAMNGGDLASISLSKHGVSMHKAPDGREGSFYTAEEVYEMLHQSGKHGKAERCDSHELWGQESPEEAEENDRLWERRIRNAAELVKNRTGGSTKGSPPCIRRILKEFSRSRLDWRMILNNFIQEDIVDYSFVPPDRRFGESPFFLPDFNEKEESAKNILFMIDCSGSVNNEKVAEAFSEVRGSVEQFEGRLIGWLGFFDTEVTEPRLFSSVTDLMEIKPIGSGGTRFDVIFEYVRSNMIEEPPEMIIILTDGYAEFPPEKEADGIPVLWIINNDRIDPPWGKVARI